MSEQPNLIDVVHMKKYFPIRGGFFKRPIGAVKAVDDVTFFIKKGETLGLVGESGCGKTTVGRSIMMLTPPTDGYEFFETPRDVVRRFEDTHGLLLRTN
ncbi:MAG: ATP-binding cassette domain-containing protein, partial [Thermoplasmata archaeon]